MIFSLAFLIALLTYHHQLTSVHAFVNCFITAFIKTYSCPTVADLSLISQANSRDT